MEKRLDTLAHMFDTLFVKDNALLLAQSALAHVIHSRHKLLLVNLHDHNQSIGMGTFGVPLDLGRSVFALHELGRRDMLWLADFKYTTASQRSFLDVLNGLLRNSVAHHQQDHATRGCTRARNSAHTG